MASDDERLLRTAEAVAGELAALRSLLEPGLDAQWSRGRQPARDETGRKARGGHADPTGDTVADPDRLYVRTVMSRVQPVLRDAHVAVRGVRLALERALSTWEGAQDDDGAPPAPRGEADQ